MTKVALRVSAVLLVSCGNYAHPPALPKTDIDLEEVAKTVDQMRWYVDAYGSTRMSAPLLVQPDPSFKFALSTTPDQFFAAERDQVSGRAAGAVASASVIGASATGSVDVVGAQQYAYALADYQRNQASVAQKRALLNEAAYRQYAASMLQAKAIKDPATRASAEAEAEKTLADALAGPASDATLTPPTPPTPPGLPSVAQIPNAAAGLLPATAAPQTLFAANTPGVTGETRGAILMAAGDVATSAMLSTLLDPSKLKSFADKQVLWGVSMVSVSPGWKTRKGYSADLQGGVTYTWTWARPEVRDAFLAKKVGVGIEQHALSELQRCVVDNLSVPPPQNLRPDDVQPSDLGHWYDGVAYTPYTFTGPTGAYPVVAAASPMGDAQSLDLQASGRSVRQTALQMAFALAQVGLSAQASTFLDFARSKQLDIETRTSNVVVSAYSSTGGFFGFKFNPRRVADPASGSEAELLSIPTFPTLLVIGMSDNDLRPRVYVDPNGACFVVEPRLSFRTSTRWVQTNEQCKTRRTNVNPCYEHELTETEIATVVANFFSSFDHAWDHYDESNDKAFATLTTLRDQAVKRAKKDTQSTNKQTPGSDEARQKTLEERKAERDVNHSADLKRYITDLYRRAIQLQDALAGNSMEMWLPPDLVAPPVKADAPKKPSITLSSPEEVVLDLADGAVAPKTFDLTIVGSDLDQLDLTKIKSGAVRASVSGKPDDKKVVLTLTVDKPGSYSFVLTAKDGSTLATTPLIVRAPTDLQIVRTIDQQKQGVKTDTIHYTAGTPSEIVKSEIEKAKVVPSNLKVDVSAGSSSTTTKDK